MKALFTAIAAVVLATSASAGTIKISDFSHKDLSGEGTAFDDTYTFELASDTWVGGLLSTGSLLGGLPAIDIQSVTLRQLGTGLSWVQNVAINWNVADGGVEKWSMTTQQLAAGSWQFEVKGVSYIDKAGNGYTATLELPEPASAALAVLALVGAGAASVRRRKA